MPLSANAHPSPGRGGLRRAQTRPPAPRDRLRGLMFDSAVYSSCSSLPMFVSTAHTSASISATSCAIRCPFKRQRPPHCVEQLRLTYDIVQNDCYRLRDVTTQCRSAPCESE